MFSELGTGVWFRVNSHYNLLFVKVDEIHAMGFNSYGEYYARFRIGPQVRVEQTRVRLSLKPSTYEIKK